MRYSTRFPLILLVLAMFVAGMPCLAQDATSGEEKQVVTTKDNAAETQHKDVGVPKAKLSDVAWIAGNWHGEAMGGKFEESWNAPMGNSMMGMFKFVKDDQVGFYELLTIVPDGESLVLRLKHFSSELKGWEKKDESVQFPLKKLTKNSVVFEGLRFEKISPDKMKIVVAVEQGEKVNEITFNCNRRN